MRDNLVQDAKSIETRGRHKRILHSQPSNFSWSILICWIPLPNISAVIPMPRCGEPELRQSPMSSITSSWGQEVNDLLKEAWSLPPAIKMIAELDANRQMFTGKHIWEPGIMRWGCQRCGFVGSGSMISPARDAMDISSGHKSGKQFALGAIGIKSKTPEQKAKTEAYKARRSLRSPPASTPTWISERLTMKILIIDKDSCGLGMALKFQEAHHQVKLFISPASKSLQSWSGAGAQG